MKLKEIVLNEGGKALSTPRISKADIPSTIKHISKISGIPVKDLEALGSVGKTETSGDIDLAVNLNKYDPATIHKKMVEVLGDDYATYNGGTKIGSYAVPVRGKEGGKRVQTDLMYGDNVEWLKFAYYSAGDESKYKGVIRTILIMGVAAAINEKGMDHFEFDGEDLIIRAGRTVDLTKGLRRIFQHRPKKKKGDGYVKTMKSIPIDKFKEMFPEVEIKGDSIIIDDPDMVVQALFGKDTKASDVRTAEQVLALIKRKFNKKQQDRIINMAKMRAKNTSAKLPKEMQ